MGRRRVERLGNQAPPDTASLSQRQRERRQEPVYKTIKTREVRTSGRQ